MIVSNLHLIISLIKKKQLKLEYVYKFFEINFYLVDITEPVERRGRRGAGGRAERAGLHAAAPGRPAGTFTDC